MEKWLELALLAAGVAIPVALGAAKLAMNGKVYRHNQDPGAHDGIKKEITQVFEKVNETQKSLEGAHTKLDLLISGRIKTNDDTHY